MAERILRSGYTTGSCAAAAAKAAVLLLLTGESRMQVEISLPQGGRLTIPVHHWECDGAFARCAVRKDAGDDIDATDRIELFAVVTRSDTPGVQIEGGVGIGRVTLPGLDQPVGAAAINHVPREMIVQAVGEGCAQAGYAGGIRVRIEAPEGEQVAKRTFNARLGILGGISILGTTGIVEPMSRRALIGTIRAELQMLRACSGGVVGLTPGNYGERFATEQLGLSAGRVAICSNYIGEAVDMAVELGFAGVLLIGHAGKLVKLAGGVFETHSRVADCRIELLALGAAMAGAPVTLLDRLLGCVSVDAAFALLTDAGVFGGTVDWICARVGMQLARRAGETACGAVIFTERYGLLGYTPGARELLAALKKEANG